MEITLIPDKERQKENDCKGLFFRGIENFYLSGGNYTYTKRMKLLKRMSCKGCDKCGWMLDDLHEYIFGCNSQPIIDNIINGGLYELRVTNISRDWESGYVDDYDFEFVEIKE